MNDGGIDDLVVLVDADDTAIGTAGKLAAHQQGLKHRAISALVRNAAGEFLLQRRSPAKYHSGGLWTNACCSHPRPDESAADAAHRRLAEEMGIDCRLEPLFTFSYRENVPGGLIEDEFVHVFGGEHDGAIKPNPDEVSEWRWIRYDDLVNEIRMNPERYTVWFRHYVGRQGGLILNWLAGKR